jgi:tetratricopeptide (TPR) repeat protein
VWNSDPDANRSKARIELIEFLLKKNAPTQAESELMALTPSLPPDAGAHLQAAGLFEQAKDYASALAQYREVLRFEPQDTAALAGAGQAAYLSGNYVTAQHYLEDASRANPDDIDSRHSLAMTELILRTNPFHSHISDAERNRRIATAFVQAEARLTECAEQTNLDLNAAPANAATPPSAALSANASPLSALQSRWTAVKPDLERLRSPAESALPDTIMDVVFQIEQQTAATCGPPQGPDLALLLISEKREAANQ